MNMQKKMLMLLYMALAVAQAQTVIETTTKIRETQIGPRAPVTEPSLLLQMPDGSLRRVPLGNGLSIDASGSIPRLVVTVVAAPRLRQVMLTRTPDPSTWGIPPGVDVQEVARNGQLVREGADYDRTGGNIVFRPAAAMGSEEIATALTFSPPPPSVAIPSAHPTRAQSMQIDRFPRSLTSFQVPQINADADMPRGRFSCESPCAAMVGPWMAGLWMDHDSQAGYTRRRVDPGATRIRFRQIVPRWDGSAPKNPEAWFRVGL